MNRRRLLQSAAAVIFVAGAGPAVAAGVGKAGRPRAPWRVWFQPRLFIRDMDLYRNMTVDASGWIDPRLAHMAGKTTLRWTYGTNHPEARDGGPWKRDGSVAGRTVGSGSEAFTAAGIALDEWVPPRSPEMEGWIADGLRAARREDPEVFVAVWYTDLRPALTELVKDGTVDLAIIEGYTHAAPEFGPEAFLAWDTAIRRCEAAKSAGILAKTIFCFGHITAKANAKGQHLSGRWLEEKLREIKSRYPEMPGIAFFEDDSAESPELKELVRLCDRLSGELWPSQ